MEPVTFTLYSVLQEFHCQILRCAQFQYLTVVIDSQTHWNIWTWIHLFTKWNYKLSQMFEHLCWESTI